MTPTYLTETQVHAILGQITAPRDLAMFTLCYYRGLRVSELGLIHRRDIDLAAGIIQFDRKKGSNGGRYMLTAPELAALETWLNDPKCGDSIFPLSRVQVYTLFRRYAGAAGIPLELQHPHILKHSIATHLLDRGLTVTDVQDWLGHKDIKNTLIYARVTPERRRAAALKAFPT